MTYNKCILLLMFLSFFYGRVFRNFSSYIIRRFSDLLFYMFSPNNIYDLVQCYRELMRSDLAIGKFYLEVFPNY